MGWVEEGPPWGKGGIRGDLPLSCSLSPPAVVTVMLSGGGLGPAPVFHLQAFGAEALFIHLELLHFFFLLCI